MITKEDLPEQLREQGVESIERVKKCYLESDGRMSVIQSSPAAEPSDSPEKCKV